MTTPSGVSACYTLIASRGGQADVHLALCCGAGVVALEAWRCVLVTTLPLFMMGTLAHQAHKATIHAQAAARRAAHLCHASLVVREQQAWLGAHAGAALPQLQLHQEAWAGLQDLWRQQHPGLRWQAPPNRLVAGWVGGMAVLAADTQVQHPTSAATFAGRRKPPLARVLHFS